MGNFKKLILFGVVVGGMGGIFSGSAEAAKKLMSYADLVQKNLQLRRALQDRTKQCADLENEKDVLVQHVRNVKKKLDQLETRHRKERTLRETCQARETALVKERQTLDQKNKKLTEDHQALLEEKKRLEKTYRQAQLRLKTQQETAQRQCQDTLARKEAAWAEERAAFEDREEKLKIEKASLKENLDRIIAEARQRQETYEALEQEFLALKKELARKEARIKKQQQALQAREQTIKTLKVDKFAVESKLAKQQEEILVEARRIADKKIRALRKQTDKERLDMHFNLAVVYDKNGMYEDSEREYLKCLQIDPNDADVHYNLAILYDDKLNRNEDAIRHYKKFLELRPKGQETDRVRRWILFAEEEQRMGPELR